MQNPNYSVPLEQGAPFVLRPTAPGAGVDLAALTPNHVRRQFNGARFSFQSDANAAARRITITLADTTGTFFTWQANATQTAGLTRFYFLRPQDGDSLTAISGNLQGTWPVNHILLPGVTLNIAAENIQVGDEFDNIAIYGQQWMERSV